jgi:hypothetical protein
MYRTVAEAIWVQWGIAQLFGPLFFLRALALGRRNFWTNESIHV